MALTNEQRIFTYMRDPEYSWTLAFYPNVQAAGPWTANELPGLDWPVRRVVIHPCGRTETNHWRLSLNTHELLPDGKEDPLNKRTFFNNSNAYLQNGFGQMRVGPGKDDWVDVQFSLPVTGAHTLEKYLRAALQPQVIGPNDDHIFPKCPMSWMKYTNYPKVGECRHWTQAVARQFWQHGLIQNDPTPVFIATNQLYGYPNYPIQPIPMATFYQAKPAIKLAEPGIVQQIALDNSSWDFEAVKAERAEGKRWPKYDQ